MDAANKSNIENVESQIDEKRDGLVHELHGVQLSLLSDPHLRAEMPPFFFKECAKVLKACVAGYFATTLYGYDASVMSGINIMPQYQKYFGVAAIGGSTGLIFSLFYAGAMVAIAFGPVLSDKFGRKMPIIVGSIVALIGAIIQVAAINSKPPYEILQIE